MQLQQRDGDVPPEALPVPVGRQPPPPCLTDLWLWSPASAQGAPPSEPEGGVPELGCRPTPEPRHLSGREHRQPVCPVCARTVSDGAPDGRRPGPRTREGYGHSGPCCLGGHVSETQATARVSGAVDRAGRDSPKIPPTSNKVDSSPAFLTSR